MKFLLALAVTLLTLSFPCTAAADNQGIQVRNEAMEGDERIYRVVCENSRRLSIKKLWKEGKYCYFKPLNDEEVCVAAENIDDAAYRACAGI